MMLLTVQEVAAQLNLSPRQVRYAIDRGDLPAYRFPVVRIAEDDVARWVRSAKHEKPQTRPTYDFESTSLLLG